MLRPDHKGAQSALEQAIAAERAKLVSAHAVQTCLYEVLLYAEGEDAVVYAERTWWLRSWRTPSTSWIPYVFTVNKHRATAPCRSHGASQMQRDPTCSSCLIVYNPMG